MPSDTPSIFSISPYARFVAEDMYPGQAGQDDQNDAARHMLAAGTLARKYGVGPAEFLGRAHEYTTSPIAAFKALIGAGKMPKDYDQDMHNNALGARLGARARSQTELEDMANQMAEQATKKQTTGKPWISRAEGGAVDLSRPFVGDLQNTGLTLTSDRLGDLKKYQDMGIDVPEYTNQDDINKIIELAYPAKPVEGFADGGYVDYDPARIDQVINRIRTDFDLDGAANSAGFAEGGAVSGANFPTDDFDPARIDSIVGELHAMNAR
jgi:hypothetical protein